MIWFLLFISFFSLYWNRVNEDRLNTLIKDVQRINRK